jgi:hypothetical protein
MMPACRERAAGQNPALYSALDCDATRRDETDCSGSNGSAKGPVHGRPPRPKDPVKVTFYDEHGLSAALLWRRGSQSENDRRVGIQTEPSTHPEQNASSAVELRTTSAGCRGLDVAAAPAGPGNSRMGKALDFTDIAHRHLDWLHCCKETRRGYRLRWSHHFGVDHDAAMARPAQSGQPSITIQRSCYSAP